MLFLGLLMMKNLVKPESAKVINTLKLAQLRCVMVTGERCFVFVLTPEEHSAFLHYSALLSSPFWHQLTSIDVMFIVGLTAGDNILTAVNVAKNCGMVESHEKVIYVNATPPTDQSMPTLKFNLEDVEANGAPSSVEVITQVGPPDTQC